MKKEEVNWSIEATTTCTTTNLLRDYHNLICMYHPCILTKPYDKPWLPVCARQIRDVEESCWGWVLMNRCVDSCCVVIKHTVVTVATTSIAPKLLDLSTIICFTSIPSVMNKAGTGTNRVSDCVGWFHNCCTSIPSVFWLCTHEFLCALGNIVNPTSRCVTATETECESCYWCTVVDHMWLNTASGSYGAVCIVSDK